MPRNNTHMLPSMAAGDLCKVLTYLTKPEWVLIMVVFSPVTLLEDLESSQTSPLCEYLMDTCFILLYCSYA